MFGNTLHEAMRIVLLDRPGSSGTTTEISEEIASRGLYRKKDGGTAKASQIGARARKYPKLFSVDFSTVKLALE
jgi:hypothetical protein